MSRRIDFVFVGESRTCYLVLSAWRHLITMLWMTTAKLRLVSNSDWFLAVHKGILLDVGTFVCANYDDINFEPRLQKGYCSIP